MLELQNLEAAIADFSANADLDLVDPRRLSSAVDRLQGALCRVLDRGRRRGDHQLARLSPTGWAARTCGLSRNSAQDRLCVGKHLDSMPEVAGGLTLGEIGYQAAAAACHLREQLGEKWVELDEKELARQAGGWSVEDFRRLCRGVRYRMDPDGLDKESEEDFERRWLQVSPMLDGMYSVEGVLDSVTGSELRKALDSLATWRGAEDRRSHAQRMADALGELLEHRLNQGRLPQRKGVRPHLTLSTTLAGLKGEAGAAAAELEPGILISNKTVQRVACDCTISRVLLADSMVVDVGRATRSIPPAMRRALDRRDGGCRWPGCDRPPSWATPHHIEHWSRGGPTNLPNLLLLCHFHHRLVHEEGWEVVRAEDQLEFIPPAHLGDVYARGPGVVRWAA